MKTLAALAVLLLLMTPPAKSGGAFGTLLVLNKSDNTVSLIDLGSSQTVATVPTGVGPHEAIVSPDGKLAVITNYGARTPGNSLTVIDIAGKKAIRTIDLGEYRRPHGIVWLQRAEVVVTAEANKALLIVNIESGEIKKAIPTGQDVSHMVVVSAKHQKAFVANIGSGSVTVIDLRGGSKVTDINTGAGAEGIDISPNENEVWVSNRAADTISIIDTASLKILGTLESKKFPIRVKFTSNGKHVLVSNAQSGDVVVFDAKARKEIKRVPMEVTAAEASQNSNRLFTQFGKSPVPVGILVAPKLPLAFVANTNADIVTVIDISSWSIAGRLTAGKEPDGLAYTPLIIR